MSKRVLLTIEYDGSAYCGWQRQLNGPSVQQKVEEALFKVTGERIGIIGASRTDAGVHALGQRAHFDMGSNIPADKVPFALNTRLPRDIRVTAGREVDEHFHARFDAAGKEYGYLIYNRRHPSALLRDLSAHVSVRLDESAMERACRHLPGTHDFAAFQAAGGTAKTTIRRIDSVSVGRQGDEIRLVIYGTAFLYNMVRIIAGTLIAIGLKRLPPDALARGIETRDRLALGPTAPASGLVLEKIWYPGE